ncbi:MAG: Uncharacterized protein FD151_880, partial [bacterium]
MTDREYVCEKCFNDPKLIQWIREDGVISNCEWCGSRKVKVLSLYEIGEAFRDVASIYVAVTEPYGYGDSIEYLLQEDWHIFSERITEAIDDRFCDLTLAILNAGTDPKEDIDLPDYSGYFRSPSNWLENDWEQKIEALFVAATDSSALSEITNSDEFAPPPDVLAVAFEDLAEEYPYDKIFYRARIHKDRLRTERFNKNELGAPSPNETLAGRGNRKGEPVLYLASDAKTAIAEVRAWRHAAVAVAEVKLAET